jgi:hypothetical protein
MANEWNLWIIKRQTLENGKAFYSTCGSDIKNSMHKQGKQVKQSYILSFCVASCYSIIIQTSAHLKFKL